MEYSRSQIRVIVPTVALVRRRPGMYIGDVEDGSGYFNMICEVLSNSLDQFLGGHCTRIHVTLRADGVIQVDDDGAGIAVHEVDGVPFLQRVLTTMHVTATADGHAPHEHLGRGVGVFIVNALSARLEVQTHRDGHCYAQRYEQGVPEVLTCHGPSAGRGTSLSFLPDPEIFGESSVNTGMLTDRLRELASLLPGLELELTDQRSLVFRESQSLAGLLRRMPNYNSTQRIGPLRIAGMLEQIEVQILAAWLPQAETRIESFANILRTTEHGTHVDGFHAALIAAARREFPERCAALTASEIGERVSPGLHAVVCVRLVDPAYGHPTKDRLSTPTVREVVKAVAEPTLCAFIADTAELRARLLAQLID